MPTLYASPTRVVIYDGSGTQPETAPLSNLSRVRFCAPDLDYIRVVDTKTGTVNLPALNTQTSGNQNPVYIKNYNVVAHGLNYTPLVFGYTTIASTHVPLRGSVMVQKDILTPAGEFGRFVSLGVNATHVTLNEYAVRRFFAISATCFPALSLNITVFLTDEAM